MSTPLGLLEPGGDAVTLLYIVSFSLFIFGIRRGTHPTTAKQGNMIAAVGMVIAIVATLLLDGIGNWGIIFGGLIVAGYADDGLEYTIGFIAIAFGAINIVGGFMVTDRMLGMFSRKKPQKPSDADSPAQPGGGAGS